MTRFRLVLDFDIRECRIARRAPIRNARPLIDQPLLVKAHENFAHGVRAALVHREALARPVARRAERSELIHDAAAVLLLPLPDALRELLTSEFVAIRTLCAKRRLHLRLRRDARMVAARHPKSIIALHAPPADQNVLQGIVERMPHVQLPRHIRRRNHDGKRLLSLLGFGMKEIVLLPELVPSLLKRLRLINLRDIILCHEKTSIHVVLTRKSLQEARTAARQIPATRIKLPANKKIKLSRPKGRKSLLPWYHLTSRKAKRPAAPRHNAAAAPAPTHRTAKCAMRLQPESSEVTFRCPPQGFSPTIPSLKRRLQRTPLLHRLYRQKDTIRMAFWQDAAVLPCRSPLRHPLLLGEQSRQVLARERVLLAAEVTADLRLAVGDEGRKISMSETQEHGLDALLRA